MAPPPPPPMCFPFNRSKTKPRRLSESNSFDDKGSHSRPSSTGGPLVRSGSYSPTATLTSRPENLTFVSDSEAYDAIPPGGDRRPKLIRSNTNAGNKLPSSKWGYGWGIGKHNPKEKEKDIVEESESIRSHSKPPTVQPPSRHNSKSSNNSKVSNNSKASENSNVTNASKVTNNSKLSGTSKSTIRPVHIRSDSQKSKRPRLFPSDSTSTLVGSAYDRKVNDVEVVREKIDSTERLNELRKLMAKDTLDYYVIPSEDAHQSEYVASSDKRREYMTGFTGSSGQAVVSKTAAYLITDSRYWLQAKDQVDLNWHTIMAGSTDAPQDWIEWIVDRVKDSRIGIDARMISHEKATLLNAKLATKSSKLVYPPQNLVDLIWKDKPQKSREPIYVQPMEFSGRETKLKLRDLRDWIKAQPPAIPTYSKSPPTPSQIHVATLITSLPCIAWLLNLRGSDIPFNPLFHSFLFVGLDRAVLFADSVKVNDEVGGYLKDHNVEVKEYNDLWAFLRRREWGEGKILISPQTPYAISLMLTHFRYTVAPSSIEETMAIKNETELEGLRRAYIRDGAAFVRFLAWLEYKFSQGYDITEYEAASRLTEYRRQNKHFMGLAYENISASGPNAALPHYSPTKSGARMIDRDTPYLNDSGGQYRDGTCDTTRTVHFGRPAPEQCEAYTRVLQGHIAIDSAVFPEGTSGKQLDVLARKALWKEGYNYLHGTGHGVGSFLTVHEGPHGFSSTVPLTQGHVTSNEPGYYHLDKWGVRIESVLAVKRVKTRIGYNGDIWLGFERLTCVPIQTKMIKENMLSKDEKQWIKDHNQRCRDKLEPYLKDDKRALKWLRREAERGIGVVGAGPGGISIEWE